MNISQKGNVTTVRYDVSGLGWTSWAFLRSDAHHDSPDCVREIEYKHLDKAKEREALIFDFGDTFDAMQGKFDPRRSLDDVRPEYAGSDYYDLIVNGTATDYAKYSANFALFARGNHETAVRKNANTDIISRIVDRMNNAKPETEIRTQEGGYGGWVRFMFSIHGTRRQSINLKYHHGSGGSAPVTKGVIQTNRQAVYLPDAHIVVNGHNHQSYIVPIVRERLNSAGKIGKDIMWFLRTPGYKDEYRDGSEGYAVEKGMPPTAVGGIWLKFEYDNLFVKVTPISEIIAP